MRTPNGGRQPAKLPQWLDILMLSVAGIRMSSTEDHLAYEPLYDLLIGKLNHGRVRLV